MKATFLNIKLNFSFDENKTELLTILNFRPYFIFRTHILSLITCGNYLKLAQFLVAQLIEV